VYIVAECSLRLLSIYDESTHSLTCWRGRDKRASKASGSTSTVEGSAHPGGLLQDRDAADRHATPHLLRNTGTRNVVDHCLWLPAAKAFCLLAKIECMRRKGFLTTTTQMMAATVLCTSYTTFISLGWDVSGLDPEKLCATLGHVRYSTQFIPEHKLQVLCMSQHFQADSADFETPPLEGKKTIYCDNTP
jgi:hypothetical protein